MDLTRKYEIEKIEKDKRLNVLDEVIVENQFEIYIEDELIAKLMCTPTDLKNLTIGHLYSLGLINSIKDIEDIVIADNNAYIRLKETRSKRSLKDSGKFTLYKEKIFNLSKRFQNNSDIFKRTGGAHSCALIKDFEIIKFEEDVARNNAVDKLIGYIISNEIDIKDKFIFISCRVSDQIIDKILSIGFNLIVSQSSPTTVSVDMARDRNVNLIGFARNERFNIYNKTSNLLII